MSPKKLDKKKKLLRPLESLFINLLRHTPLQADIEWLFNYFLVLKMCPGD